jgi:cytochrome c5
MNNGQTAVQAMELLERIRPVGNVAMEPGTPVTAQAAENAAGQASAARSGEVIYQATCAACHSTGAAGAPKTGNKTDWSARTSQGTATLVQHATQGIKAMPPKGGCSTCSDTKIRAAVEYLVSKSK